MPVKLIEGRLFAYSEQGMEGGVLCLQGINYIKLNEITSPFVIYNNQTVFDKRNMDDVLLMYHLLYTNSTEDLYGGYSLYDYSLPWYQNHLWDGKIVFRTPYLPDRIAKFQGSLPYYHNPAKTVYVR